jgi:hypothetical protein
MSEKAKRPVTGPQIQVIAVRSGRSVRTITRVYDGGGNAYSRAHVAQCARELGFPEPDPMAGVDVEALKRMGMSDERIKAAVEHNSRTNHHSLDSESPDAALDVEMLKRWGWSDERIKAAIETIRSGQNGD